MLTGSGADLEHFGRRGQDRAQHLQQGLAISFGSRGMGASGGQDGLRIIDKGGNEKGPGRERPGPEVLLDR
jgi:hypothetical protein